MADGTVPEACVEVMNEVGKYVTENAEAIYGTKNVGSAVRYRDPVDSCYTVSGSSDRNGFLQNKLRDLPEPVKLP